MSIFNTLLLNINLLSQEVYVVFQILIYTIGPLLDSLWSIKLVMSSILWSMPYLKFN